MINNPGRECSELADRKFQRLVVSKLMVSLTLTGIMFAGYFGYIGSLAYQKDLLSQKISMHITLGLPLGLGVIVLAWLLTGVYVWWANNVYDKSVAEIKILIRE